MTRKGVSVGFGAFLAFIALVVPFDLQETYNWDLVPSQHVGLNFQVSGRLLSIRAWRTFNLGHRTRPNEWGFDLSGLQVNKSAFTNLLSFSMSDGILSVRNFEFYDSGDPVVTARASATTFDAAMYEIVLPMKVALATATVFFLALGAAIRRRATRKYASDARRLCACGYDLRGTVTGICSECGIKVTSQDVRPGVEKNAMPTPH